MKKCEPGDNGSPEVHTERGVVCVNKKEEREREREARTIYY